MAIQRITFREAPVDTVWAIVVVRRIRKDVKHFKFRDTGMAQQERIDATGAVRRVTWAVDLTIPPDTAGRKVFIRWLARRRNGVVVAVATRRPQ
jgi:hypothetical protein